MCLIADAAPSPSKMLMPTAESETSGRRFLAGSLAGIITTGITYPLELIRVRLAFESHRSPNDRASLLRTIRQIYITPPTTTLAPNDLPAATSSSSPSSSLRRTPQQPRSSIANFYRGIWPTLVGIIPYAGTSFLIWGLLKQDLFPRFLAPETRRKHRAGLDLLAGGIAGAIGQTTAYPIDIVRRRMQVGRTAPGAGFWDTARGVYQMSGWRGFFIGLSIGYLKVVPMNAVSFATCESACLLLWEVQRGTRAYSLFSNRGRHETCLGTGGDAERVRLRVETVARVRPHSIAQRAFRTDFDAHWPH